MRECVVADFVAHRIFALHDAGIEVRGFTDHEKRGGGLFLFQNVENLRRPGGIGAIVKRKRDFFRGGAHFLDSPGERIALKTFVVE